MILNKLSLQNYKQYASLSLDFREGLVGIIGKNGAGKSTIFEAILYCLFGRDESNKNLVRSSFADPKANVTLELDFTIGESLYRVRREFRGKAMAVGAELFKNDQLVAKGVSPVNDELVKVLHMERDAFKRSVFSGQRELSELSDTSGEARKRMVRKMLGLDTLDEVQARVNADIRDLKSRVAGQEQNLLGDEEVASLEEQIKTSEKALKKNKSEFEKENKKLKAVEEKYRAEKRKFDEEEQRLKRFNALNRELGQLQERIAGLNAQHKTLEQKSRDLQAQKEKLDVQRPDFDSYVADEKKWEKLDKDRQHKLNYDYRAERIAELREPLQHARERIAELDKSVAELQSVETALSEAQTGSKSLEQEIETKLAEYEHAGKKISALEERINDRRNKVESLREIGKNGACPTCFQPLLDAYDRVVAQLDSEISAMQTVEFQDLFREQETVKVEGQALRKRQETFRQEIERLLKEQAKLQETARRRSAEEANLKRLEAEEIQHRLVLKEIGEVHFDAETYQKLKERLDALKPRYGEFLSREGYVARELPATIAALKNTEAGIAETEKNIAAQSAELARTGYDATRYEAAKQALTGFADALNTQSESVRVLEKSGIELQNNIARYQEKLRANERIKSQISDKLGEIELLRKLADLLGLFKTEILEKVSPGISREASELFSRITKGKYESIRVDENFDFAIADGGVFYPIERFSGGEIDLANFCLRIAITKAIMDLSGADQGIGFLAFDEIFGSQDEERRHEMMLALNYLQEQFRQIYIVSHIESLKDYFPHILEVQYGEEGSTVAWR